MFKALKRQQAQLEVLARRNRLATFTEPIQVEGDEERADLKEFLGDFYRSIYTRRDEIEMILQSLPILNKQYHTLVPSRLAYEDFWQRYFYRCDVDRILRQWARKERLTRNVPSGGEGLTASLRGFKHFIGATTDTTAAKSTPIQEEIQPKELLVTVQKEIQPKKTVFTEAPKNKAKEPPVQTTTTGRAAAKKALSAPVAAETKETEHTLTEESSVATPQTIQALTVQEEFQPKKIDSTEAPKNEAKEPPIQTVSTGRAVAKKAPNVPVAAETKETEHTLSEESSVATPQTIQVITVQEKIQPKKIDSTEAPKNEAKEPPVQTVSTRRAVAKKAPSAVAAETKETEPALSEESSVATPQTIQVTVAALVGLLAVVVWVALLSTSSPSFGNNMCAPVFPYRTLGNEPTSLEAPWWAPSSIKVQAFEITCGSRLRTRLDWTFIGKNDNVLYQLTVVNIANGARPLIKKRRATSLQIRSSYMLLSNQKGTQEEIVAPWIMG